MPSGSSTTYVDFSVTSRMEAWAVPQKQRELETWRNQCQRRSPTNSPLSVMYFTILLLPARTAWWRRVQPRRSWTKRFAPSVIRPRIWTSWEKQSIRALIYDIAWRGYFMNTFSMLSDFTASKSKFIDSERYGKNISTFITKCTKFV